VDERVSRRRSERCSCLAVLEERPMYRRANWVRHPCPLLVRRQSAFHLQRNPLQPAHKAVCQSDGHRHHFANISTVPESRKRDGSVTVFRSYSHKNEHYRQELKRMSH
jgi:hypothetical protein